MQQLLQFFILLPLAGFVVSLLLPRKKEPVVSLTAIYTIGIHFLGFLVFAAWWLLNGPAVLDIKHAVVFKTTDFEIFIDFYFDKITFVFALVGGLLTFLVAVFSRYYLHREEGFKRFFNTILFFYLGYNIIIFSGNFETLFVGWEILGLTSFLLIAFYRDRYLPVKNGLKVVSIYRLSDICLMLAMWMSHHFWHENITFLKLGDAANVTGQLAQHYQMGVFIAIMFVVAAAAKSAQLPFSSWLPRAMEGPTTSSAIFYGSLSVHLGAFILLRTFPFWQNMLAIKITIIAIGVITAVVATFIARVQSTVKTQIAYSSIAQIGIIFIEVALGLHILALVHFAGNAFLRTYQLLVSPSVLNYLIHDQFYHFAPGKRKPKTAFVKKMEYTFYMLSVKEWNLDFILYRFLWSSFKWIGRRFAFITQKWAVALLLLLFATGLYCQYSGAAIPPALYNALPVVYSFIAMILVLRAFTERKDARRAWLAVASAQFFIALAIIVNSLVEWQQIVYYLGGGVTAAVAGYICLSKIASIDNDINLHGFHGYVYEKPVIAFIFLLSCLGLLGFPITPTFIGVDLLFSHIGHEQYALILFTSLSFVFIELSVLRIYIRIFLGQHKKTYHAMAYRSS
jgi:NADH-quinone oxidoreductase subunit L